MAGAELINNEFRIAALGIVEKQFQEIQTKCFSALVMNKSPDDQTKCLQTLPDLQAQLGAFKHDLKKELEDPKCTLAQAKFTIQTAIEAHQATMLAFQPKRAKSLRLKIVSEFFDFTRDSKLSLASKTAIGGVVGLLIVLAAGAAVALTFFSGGMIPLVVAAGAAVIAGIASAMGTHRFALNPREERGKSFKNALVNTIKADGIETYCEQRQDCINRLITPTNFEGSSSSSSVTATLAARPPLAKAASVASVASATPTSDSKSAVLKPVYGATFAPATSAVSSDPGLDQSKLQPSGFLTRLKNGTLRF